MKKTLKVMVVDDEEIVCTRLKTSLEMSGFEVDVFQTGKSAIEQLKDNHYDVVVTDIRMKEIDGLKVLDAVQKNSPGTQTIMITGYATAEVAREAQEKGAFDFIAKPFKPRELRKIIERAARKTEKAGK